MSGFGLQAERDEAFGRVERCVRSKNPLSTRGIRYLLRVASRDPVSADTRTLRALLRDYNSASIERVAHRFYPEARHELFNELNPTKSRETSSHVSTRSSADVGY